MILTNNPRLDLEDAARGERIAQSNLRLAKDTIVAWDALSEQTMTNEIFEQAMEQFRKKGLL